MADKYTGITSKRFLGYLKSKDIKIFFTPTNHPQSNGLIERLNQTLISRLRCKFFEEPSKKWTDLIKIVINQYNSTPNSVTSYPPKYLLKGIADFTIDTPLEKARNEALENNKKHYEKQKYRFDQSRRSVNFCTRTQFSNEAIKGADDRFSYL